MAKRSGIRSVEISGGEPLMNFKKTLKIIELAKKMSFNVLLNTNGYFIAFPNPRRTVEKLKSVDRIALSVDYDHLRFIPYSRIIDVIKIILETDVKLSINMAIRKETTKKNFDLLKKISNDLHGRLLKLPLLDLSNLNLRYYYLSFIFYFIFCGKAIPVAIFNTVRTSVNKNKVQTPSIKLGHILFTPCMIFEPLIDYNSNVYPCCSMQALNHPRLYSIGKIHEKQGDIFEIEDPLLNDIIHGIFPFLRIFLMIRKDKKLLKGFLRKDYNIPCDFCLEVQRHRKQILKLDPPSIYEMIGFTFLNFHHFIDNTFRIIVNFLIDILEFLISVMIW